MSAQFDATNSGKKAVHVKWAGKTIALGTFPSAEADEKCARAKALTRAWRSTMRPKPGRDWVVSELERLGVRVVSGRLGRKAGDDGDDGVAAGMMDKKMMGAAGPMVGNNGGGQGGGLDWNQNKWGNDLDLNALMARRNSSLGLGMINESMGHRGSLNSLGPMAGLDSGDPAMPPHRPFVGGGSAAAYEAARHDHFTQKSAEQQRRASSLGLGSFSGMTLPGNSNQHYEMLKLHHMNLLNEIQETTLMMNLYQQQQLQQQLQQQGGTDQMSSSAEMAMMLQQQQQQEQNGTGTQQNGMNQDFGGSGQRGSLGLGPMGNFNPQQQMQLMQQQMGNGQGMGSQGAGMNQNSNEIDNRLAELKADIAQQEKEQVTDTAADNKRQPEESMEQPDSKRQKVEEGEGGGGEEEDKKEADE